MEQGDLNPEYAGVCNAHGSFLGVDGVPGVPDESPPPQAVRKKTNRQKNFDKANIPIIRKTVQLLIVQPVRYLAKRKEN